jgi:hypothetical protein
MTATRHRALSVRAERLIAITLIVLSVAIMLPKVRADGWGSANSKSRWATMESLVDHGTFAIDKSPYKATVDRVKIDGKYYSSKPPIIAVAGAGVYFVLKHGFGLSMKVRKNSPTIFALNLVLAMGAHIALLVFLFKLVSLLGASVLGRLLAVGAVGMAWFGAGYAVDVNNHLPAAAMGMAAIYFVVKIRDQRERDEATPTRDAVSAGLAIGFLPTLDLPSGALSAALVIWLFFLHRDRLLKLIAPVAAGPVLFNFWLTWLYSGSIKPVYLRPELYETKARHVSDTSFEYFFHFVLGHHGLFTMTPLLILAVVGVVRSLKRRDRTAPLALILTGVFTIQFAFYMWGTANYGGECVGPRWLIPIGAWMLAFLCVWIDQVAGDRVAIARVLLVALLFGAGTAQTLDTSIGPWRTSTWHGFVAGVRDHIRGVEPRKRRSRKPRKAKPKKVKPKKVKPKKVKKAEPKKVTPKEAVKPTKTEEKTP